MSTLRMTTPKLNTQFSKAIIDKKSYTIGRHGDFQTPLEHTSVSRLHCAILETHTGVTIRDLNSYSGTSVNGEGIGSRGRSLQDGDTIELGNTVVLVYNE